MTDLLISVSKYAQYVTTRNIYNAKCSDLDSLGNYAVL